MALYPLAAPISQRLRRVIGRDEQSQEPAVLGRNRQLAAVGLRMSSSTDWTFGFKPGVGGSGAAGRAAVR
jgi:hypothetical protein